MCSITKDYRPLRMRARRVAESGQWLQVKTADNSNSRTNDGYVIAVMFIYRYTQSAMRRLLAVGCRIVRRQLWSEAIGRIYTIMRVRHLFCNYARFYLGEVNITTSEAELVFVRCGSRAVELLNIIPDCHVHVHMRMCMYINLLSSLFHQFTRIF